jgi:glyoxylase-like metal-dependent hydrolase (beta-lactamase superfamily II)
VQEIAPGIWHWTAGHPKIGVDVSSYFLPELALLIDPLTPPEFFDRLDELGPPRHILLTNRHHWRSSDELVERFGCDVRAPKVGMHEFDDGDPVEPYDFGEELLDGAVQAHEVGGISPDESALFIPSARALAVADGVISYDGLRFVPDEHFDDPESDQKQLRDAYSRLASELDFDALLPAHGEPIGSGAREQLREFAAAG